VSKAIVVDFESAEEQAARERLREGRRIDHAVKSEAHRRELAGIENRLTATRDAAGMWNSELAKHKPASDEHHIAREAAFNAECQVEKLTARVATIQAAIATHERTKP